MDFGFVLPVVPVDAGMWTGLGFSRTWVGRVILWGPREDRLGGHILEPGPAQASVAGGLLLLIFRRIYLGLSGPVWVGFSRVLIVACFWFGSPGDFGIENLEIPDFFWVLGPEFSGGLNWRSAVVSICGIRICIGSGGFGWVRWGSGGGLFGDGA